MTLVDDNIRAIVRKAVEDKPVTAPRPPLGSWVQLVAAVLLGTGIAFLSDFYADYRVETYLEFHRMMQTAGR